MRKTIAMLLFAASFASTAFAQEKPKTLAEFGAVVSEEIRAIPRDLASPEANSTKDAAFAGAATAGVLWIGVSDAYLWSNPVSAIVVLTVAIATKKFGAHVRGEER